MGAHLAHHPLDRFADVSRPIPGSLAKGTGMAAAIRRAVKASESASLHVTEHGAHALNFLSSGSQPVSVADALRRRMAPNTGLHRQQLADAIGVTQRTVDNWLDGIPPQGPHLLELMRFFDPTFTVEVVGKPIPRLADVRRARDAARLLLAELEAAS